MPNSTILTSWKEIAGYLGKSVRTVQRWEATVGLPVRRPNGSDGNLVIALPQELDAWLKRGFRSRSHVHHSGELERMHRLVTIMFDQSERIRKNTTELIKTFERIRAQQGAPSNHKPAVSRTSEHSESVRLVV